MSNLFSSCAQRGWPAHGIEGRIRILEYKFSVGVLPSGQPSLMVEREVIRSEILFASERLRAFREKRTPPTAPDGLPGASPSAMDKRSSDTVGRNGAPARQINWS